MSEPRIRSIVVKKIITSQCDEPVAAKMNQDFTITGINQKWWTDITAKKDD